VAEGGPDDHPDSNKTTAYQKTSLSKEQHHADAEETKKCQPDRREGALCLKGLHAGFRETAIVIRGTFFCVNRDIDDLWRLTHRHESVSSGKRFRVGIRATKQFDPGTMMQINGKHH
jgi:hypothetical protein